MGQQGTGNTASSRVPRTSSIAKGKLKNEAPKKVYSTLQSPNVDTAATADCGTAPDQGGEDRGAGQDSETCITASSQRPVVQKNPAPVDHLLDAHTDKKPPDSTDSQRQSTDVPRSVAALANRFETKVTPGLVSARPATVPFRPTPQAQVVSKEQQGAMRSGLPKAPSSGSRSGAARIQTPTQPWRKDTSTSDVVGEASVVPADSHSVQPIPQDPRLQRKAEASSMLKQEHQPVACTADVHPAAANNDTAPQDRVATPARPTASVQERRPKIAVPLHAAAFGSPMHGPAAADDDDNKVPNIVPGRNSVLSMSCNVNIASPTTADGEVMSEWKQPAVASVHPKGCVNLGINSTRSRCVKADRHGEVVDRPDLKDADPTDGEAKANMQKKSSKAQVAAASPPTRAALARLSDACTSPVDSLWVRCHMPTNNVESYVTWLCMLWHDDCKGSTLHAETSEEGVCPPRWA